MDIVFPVSGVEAPLWFPPLVAFVLSAFTSTAGVSGAFLLLPIQMSVLGFVSPAVSSTNLVFNVTGIPGGLYRYFREGRLVWPLAFAVVLGTLPGVSIGVLLRVGFLSDPAPFKAFAGAVLLYVGVRLIRESVRRGGNTSRSDPSEVSDTVAESVDWRVEVICFNRSELRFRFRGQEYSVRPFGIIIFSFVVGIVGGAYGIGGGAIVAPVLVTFYGLPLHAVAGATLAGTFVASLVGVLLYQGIAFSSAFAGMAVGPDWGLGALFGVGGLAGMYLGARLQSLVPSNWLKLMLGLMVVFVAARYVLAYFGS